MINIKPEELEKYVKEAIEKINDGAEMPALLEEYKEKLSMQEAFWVLLQAQMKSIIPEKFHNFTGNVRNK